jgi:hypothetical protein
LTKLRIATISQDDTIRSVTLWEETMTKDNELTISVPEAGRRYFGIGRTTAFEAARRGEIPTIKIGRLLRVPVRAMEAMLDRASATENHRSASAAR